MPKQSSHKSRKCSPVSVRVTHEERAALERAAGSMSLSRYIRSRLFHDQREDFDECEMRSSSVTRQKLLAQILMQLGQSDLANSLSELSKYARLGLLEANPDIAPALSDLRDEFQGLRRDLVKALGLRPRKDGDR